MTYKYKKIPGLKKAAEFSLGLIALGEVLQLVDELQKEKKLNERNKQQR